MYHNESGSSDEAAYDILIVGGGMAGAALACALGRAGTGWRIALVDPSPYQVTDFEAPTEDPDSFDLRVSALTQASERFLRSLDVWSDMAKRKLSPYRGMYVWDADGTGHIEFHSADLYEPALGHIVENRVTLAALWCRLNQLPVQVLEGRVSGLQRLDQRTQLRLTDGRELCARLIVAADGADSVVRRLAGFPTWEWDYQQQAIVATVVTEKSHAKTAWQRFLPSGPLAFLPFSLPGNDHYSSIVWSTQPELAQELVRCDHERFLDALGQAFEYRLGKVVGVSRRAAFPLRQRHAKSYVQPGVVLVADAAHTIHPLAGQGINLGFLDVAVLADELLRAHEREIDFADLAVLQRYQRRRMGHNLAMMSAMEGFKRLFGADPLPLRWMRNTGMRWLNSRSAIKNRIASMAMGQDLLPERWQPRLRSWGEESSVASSAS